MLRNVIVINFKISVFVYSVKETQGLEAIIYDDICVVDKNGLVQFNAYQNSVKG